LVCLGFEEKVCTPFGKVYEVFWFNVCPHFLNVHCNVRGRVIKQDTNGYKTWNMWYWDPEKHVFLNISSTNTDTLVPLFYQCVETRSIEVVWLLSQPLPDLRFIIRYIRTSLREILDTVVNRLTRQTLPTVNRKYLFMNILCIEYFWPQKTHNRMLLFGSTPLLKHSRHFDYWNQPLNMGMRVCYLDFHVTGLCHYLVIQIENLLHSLPLFYFHLWPIYWRSLVLWDQVEKQ
jgi:hypothetical protein